jgi:drug/metabolite transporter (DMT)-like permease
MRWMTDSTRQSRAGVALAAVTAAISGVSVWINAFGVSQVSDAMLYTTLKNTVAVGVLLAVFVVARRLPRPAPAAGHPGINASWPRALAVIAVGTLGGGAAFILFFSGLAQAAAAGGAGAAFIQKTLFIWVALLAVPFLGERLGLAQLGAVATLLVGQVLLAPPRTIGWGSGEAMILSATLIWAGEVIVARRLLAVLPSLTLGIARLGIGLLVLVGAVVLTGRASGIGAVTATGWGFIVLTGVLLAAYVGTWFAALQRAPASLVTCVLVGGAIVTAALQAASSGRAPEVGAIAGSVLMIAALVMVVAHSRSRRALSIGAPAVTAGSR